MFELGLRFVFLVGEWGDEFVNTLPFLSTLADSILICEETYECWIRVELREDVVKI